MWHLSRRGGALFPRIGVGRNLTEKVGRVQIFGWEFSRKLGQSCVGVIPTFLQVLRKLFCRVGGIVLYSPGRRKSRDYSEASCLSPS